MACHACASGKFKESTGSHACTDCPALTYTRGQTGSKNISACKCLQGLVGVGGGPCMECPSEYYETIGETNAVPLQDTFHCFDYGQSGCCRMEVYHNGQWGNVCDDRISLGGYHSERAVAVACRSLNCSDSGGTFKKQATGSHHNHIWLDDIECAGDENTLADCNHRPWGLENCNSNEHIAFCCSDCVSTVSWLGTETGIKSWAAG